MTDCSLFSLHFIETGWFRFLYQKLNAHIKRLKKYSYSRYKQVVDVCALKKDFEQLPNGDQTLVGEKGVSLSGGQRARINLARAVYSDAEIYLLDDPLSAVDTHVAKDLFEKCIQGFLKNKTVLLATHQLQFIKYADIIVVVNNVSILL